MNSLGVTGFGGKNVKKGKLSGGAAADVHQDLASQMEVKLQFSNGVIDLLGLYSSSENLIIAIVYRQPDDVAGGHRSTAKELKHAMDELQRSITDMGDPAPNIIVCGDFNLPSILWQDGHEPEVTNDRDMFNCISDFTSVNFLQQHITNPTHRDGNTLDLIFTNNSNSNNSFHLFPQYLITT